MECEFFELPEWAILFMKRKEGGFMEDHIFDLLNPKKEELLEEETPGKVVLFVLILNKITF